MLTIKILHVFTIFLLIRLKKAIHSKHFFQFLSIIKALNFA